MSLLIGLFDHLFIEVWTHIIFALGYNLKLLFISFRLSQLWSLGILSGWLLCLCDLSLLFKVL